MYLLYSRKSTNPYSLIFTTMNMVSSSLWITYSQMVSDTPIFIRGTSDLILFSISTMYIIHNRIESETLPSDDILISGFECFALVPKKIMCRSAVVLTSC
jgi:hypothetical protein